MAELSYDDVRRAAQTAVSNLQSAIGDLRTNLQNTRSDISRLNPNNDFQYRFNNLERAILDLTQYMQRFDSTLQNAQSMSVGMQQTQQLVLRVEQRLVNTEHMIGELSRYMEVLHSQVVQMSEINAHMFGRAEP